MSCIALAGTNDKPQARRRWASYVYDFVRTVTEESDGSTNLSFAYHTDRD